MKFSFQDKNGLVVAGMSGVSLDNPYIGTYGVLIRGLDPSRLKLGEFCVKEYSLSGQTPTQYWIVRVE